MLRRALAPTRRHLRKSLQKLQLAMRRLPLPRRFLAAASHPAAANGTTAPVASTFQASFTRPATAQPPAASASDAANAAAVAAAAAASRAAAADAAAAAATARATHEPARQRSRGGTSVGLSRGLAARCAAAGDRRLVLFSQAVPQTAGARGGIAERAHRKGKQHAKHLRKSLRRTAGGTQNISAGQGPR